MFCNKQTKWKLAILSAGVPLMASTASTWAKEAGTPGAPASPAVSEATRQQVPAAYGKLPLSFEANQGQTDAKVKFLARGSDYTLFLTSTDTVFLLKQPQFPAMLKRSTAGTDKCLHPNRKRRSHQRRCG